MCGRNLLSGIVCSCAFLCQVWSLVFGYFGRRGIKTAFGIFISDWGQDLLFWSEVGGARRFRSRVGFWNRFKIFIDICWFLIRPGTPFVGSGCLDLPQIKLKALRNCFVYLSVLLILLSLSTSINLISGWFWCLSMLSLLVIVLNLQDVHRVDAFLHHLVQVDISILFQASLLVWFDHLFKPWIGLFISSFESLIFLYIQAAIERKVLRGFFANRVLHL
jgi:hypothetical protein